jgi:hypothetical protein
MCPYDVSPDGRTFLVAETQWPERDDQILLVLNWFKELKRLVPSDPPSFARHQEPVESGDVVYEDSDEEVLCVVVGPVELWETR